MSQLQKAVMVLVLAALLGAVGGCRYFGDSYETAASFDQSGQSQQAIQAYQSYLKAHPHSALAALATYRVGKNFANQSDYINAIHWYEKVVSDYPKTDEELHALLDLASLYRNQVKDPSKSMTYAQKAFGRYLDNGQARDAVETLVEAQYLTADAQYSAKNFKGAASSLDSLYKTYPVGFIALDTRAKVDSLADRVRRAMEIARASSDQIVLKSEMPFTKNYEADFPTEAVGEAKIVSPDGSYIAARKKAVNGIYYLYVAKVPAKGDQVVFNLVKQTFGADKPSWSPDGQKLVYWRLRKGMQKLEETDIRDHSTQTLFYTKTNKGLGLHPAYHPAGNKIAFTYEGDICLQNIGANSVKQLLKTKQKLDYTAELAWSSDGTLLRCRQTDKHGKIVDELFALDVNSLNGY